MHAKLLNIYPYIKIPYTTMKVSLGKRQIHQSGELKGISRRMVKGHSRMTTMYQAGKVRIQLKQTKAFKRDFKMKLMAHLV
jgi:hypothetical protein